MDTKLIYFDLDGVLADFDTTYRRLTGTLFPKDSTLTEEQKNEKWANLNPHPNFFLDLPWVPGARPLIGFTMKHAPHGVGVLSAASKRISQSPAQKVQWCRREMPWMATNNVVIVHHKRDKVNYVGSGNILVDDYPVNIERWKEAGGTGILFENAVQALTDLQAIVKAPESLYQRMLKIVKEESK